MSSSTVNMNEVSEALDASILASRPSEPTLSRVPSFTYPLSRVHTRTTMPPPPPSPALHSVREDVTNVAHGRVEDTFRLNNLPENPVSDMFSWTYVPRLRLPAGVDPDEDEDGEDWDLDVFPLAVRTVDSMDIIRRNTDEKRLGVGSCINYSGKIVLKGARRSLERMVRNRVAGLVRRLTS